jgi:hypothetical protein
VFWQGRYARYWVVERRSRGSAAGSLDRPTGRRDENDDEESEERGGDGDGDEGEGDNDV